MRLLSVFPTKVPEEENQRFIIDSKFSVNYTYN